MSSGWAAAYAGLAFVLGLALRPTLVCPACAPVLACGDNAGSSFGWTLGGAVAIAEALVLGVLGVAYLARVASGPRGTPPLAPAPTGRPSVAPGLAPAVIDAADAVGTEGDDDAPRRPRGIVDRAGRGR